jgi:serine/threonine-protein kinase RsbW
MENAQTSTQAVFVPARLNAHADTTELEKIRTFIGDKARACGFSEQGVMKITLAVDEACSNLIRHSYHYDASQQFFVDVDFDNNALVIDILDSGAAFDPMNIPPPNLKEYAEQHRRGGFGVHIIRMTMDVVEYLPADDNHRLNRLRLIKKVI